jgi:quinone-reactive Ni/Fe-hydrogenase small subunit
LNLLTEPDPELRAGRVTPSVRAAQNSLEYYEKLAREADAHLSQVALGKPANRKSFSEGLERSGIDRREFLKWAAVMGATLGLPSFFSGRVARAATLASRLPVVWVELQSCTGNSEAVIRNANPGIDTVILEMLSLDYSELLMAAAGDQAEAAQRETIRNFRSGYLAVFEGSLPVGDHEQYLRIGAEGETGVERVRRIARDAKFVLNAGSCAAYGNLPSANPNPTTAIGIGEFLRREGISTPVINIPGCPMNGINFIGTVLEILMFGRVPQLDTLGRPLWAFGKTVHDQCERRGHFEKCEMVMGWDDIEGLKKGYCLYMVGCKGPFTYANCGQVRFNQATSWPIMAGHGCIACTEPNFIDRFTPFEDMSEHHGEPGGSPAVMPSHCEQMMDEEGALPGAPA